MKLIFEALQQQTFKDFEVIVCDDGSSDGTKEYFEELERYDCNDCKYFWQEDKGFRLAKSKNNGIRAAEGEYFLSLEADVIPHRRLLEEYAKWAEPDLILLGVRHDIEELPDKVDFDDLDDRIVDKDFRLPTLRKFDQVTDPWRHCSGCNVLFPTSKLGQAGGWNEDFTFYGVDDYEVCLRMVMNGCRIRPLPAAYGYHLKHEIRPSRDENWEILENLEKEYYANST